jgi:hypothetical protein
MGCLYQMVKDQIHHSIHIDNCCQPIRYTNTICSPTFRYLGVMIDDKLNFYQHVKKICQQVTFKTNVLKKCAYLFDIQFKTILFKLFIQSELDYCSTLLLHLNNK